ncbi:MAG: MlaD family protein [Paludibacteraceae bacterium]|nr:MlaD family protein [Paludibacteraceae bacterium]
MKHSKELKIGVAFVLALALLVYGINFLKGINLFSPTNTYYLVYDNLDGLVISNGVYIKGYKVGQVKDIRYDFKKEHPFIVEIIINDDIEVPNGSVANLYDASMLGGKGINLVLGAESNHYASGDTLPTDIEKGLVGALAEVVPTLQTTIGHVDSAVVSVNSLLNSDEIAHSLENLEAVTSDLKSTSKRLDYMMNVEIPPVISKADKTLANINSISEQLNEADYKRIMSGIDTAIQNVQGIASKFNSPEGTIGQLLTNHSLYDSINTTIGSVNALVIDLKANPKKYVHFSLFGGSEKKNKK